MGAEARVAELGLELPAAAKPAGVYKPLVIVGNLAYTSGHVSIRPDGSRILGKVGDDLTLEDGQVAARCAGLCILTTLRAGLGSLDRVRRVVKTLGFVNAAPDFKDHPAVINGCSELFKQVFGDDAGVGARSALGAGSLPLGTAVEVEAIFEID
jgi:enamine deaminase RidA (YjgF/YER057c/UK114 family)